MTDLAATRRALDWAEARLCEGVTLSDKVWRCLEDAADTLHRLPDNDLRYLLAADRISWREVQHTYEERLEEENQRLELLRSDPSMLRGDTLTARKPIMDPTAQNRMLTVLGWLTTYVTGRTDKAIKRDQLITLALAQGRSSAYVRARYMKHARDTSAVRMVKLKVVGQISSRLDIWLTLTKHPSNCVNSFHAR